MDQTNRQTEREHFQPILQLAFTVVLTYSFYFNKYFSKWSYELVKNLDVIKENEIISSFFSAKLKLSFILAFLR